MINKLSRYVSIKEYRTKDGSEIRELIHPQKHGNENISVAEARVHPGASTLAHYHRESEEIYVELEGRGRMRRGDEVFEVEKGVFVAIMAGEVHSLENSGKEDLVIFCCCAPAYAHTDTVLA